MKPVKACLGTCLLALISPVLAEGAEVKPQINYVYYSVPYAPGLSAKDLILRHSPLSNSGRPFSGYTRYDFRYEINYDNPTIDVCRINNPQVICDCEITLPRLEGGGADPELGRQFAAELARIGRHEQTHCDIAVRHAETMLATFQKLKDMPCKNRDEIVNRHFQEIVEACKVDQTRFDHSEYGYKDHLRFEGMQRMMDAGFNIVPPSEYEFSSQSGRTAPPGNLQSVAPPSAGELKQKGIYKDENGVWRNY